MGAFVYMLRCADGSFYVGSATGDDLEKRIAEHQTGAYPGYTFARRPVRLVARTSDCDRVFRHNQIGPDARTDHSWHTAGLWRKPT